MKLFDLLGFGSPFNEEPIDELGEYLVKDFNEKKKSDVAISIERLLAYRRSRR